MGTWSHESFGNDDACDWVSQLEEFNDISLVESALDAVLAVGDEYLEAPEAWAAIAAAEVVARLQGNCGPQDDTAEQVDAWVERVKLQPSLILIGKAHRALDRILTEPSELKELWDESEESGAWQTAVEELKVRTGPTR